MTALYISGRVDVVPEGASPPVHVRAGLDDSFYYGGVIDAQRHCGDDQPGFGWVSADWSGAWPGVST